MGEEGKGNSREKTHPDNDRVEQTKKALNAARSNLKSAVFDTVHSPAAETTSPIKKNIGVWGKVSPHNNATGQSLKTIMLDEEAMAISNPRHHLGKRLNSVTQASSASTKSDTLLSYLPSSFKDTPIPLPPDEEDKLLKIALERSLNDLHFDPTQLPYPGTAQNKSRAFSQSMSALGSSISDLDFARRIQAESETTETFIESPHGTHSERKVRPPLHTGFSERSLASIHSLDQALSGGSSHSARGDGRQQRQQPDLGASISSVGSFNVQELHHSASSFGQRTPTTNSKLSIRTKRTPQRISPQMPQHKLSLAEPVAAAPNLSDSQQEIETADLSPEDEAAIRKALEDTGDGEDTDTPPQNPSATPDEVSPEDLVAIQAAMHDGAATTSPTNEKLSAEDSAAIQAVLREMEQEEQSERERREAQEEAERQSIQLALQLMQEDSSSRQSFRPQGTTSQGNVRTMTRAEYQADQVAHRVGAFQSSSPPRQRHPLEEEEEEEMTRATSSGFRLNANTPQDWSRRDQNTVVGPNNEIRTKHDTTLQGRANAERLGLNVHDDEEDVVVGNKAYNSFMSSIKKKTKKGVSTHGTGRAGSDADGTTGGALDNAARIQVGSLINMGIFEKLNGVVKEGKEAIIFHADEGPESGGYDVAVKVFKRIQEFKGRGDYVTGDPRYAGVNFNNISHCDQLTMWAEKEHRNLIRADRAGVPVPRPLITKGNVLCMRFIGSNAYPAPQLREVNIRRGSKVWLNLYNQIIHAMGR